MSFWDWADKHWFLVSVTVIGWLVIIYDHRPVIRITLTRTPKP